MANRLLLNTIRARLNLYIKEDVYFIVLLLYNLIMVDATHWFVYLSLMTLLSTITEVNPCWRWLQSFGLDLYMHGRGRGLRRYLSHQLL